MKNLYLLPLFILMAFVMPACSDDDDNTSGDNTITETTATKYSGTLTVNSSFTKDDTECHINFNEAGDTATLDIFKVKFAENMPVTLDITVPGIACTAADGKITFSGSNIVPLIGVAPSPGFTFSEIQGTIENKKLTFTASIINRGTFIYNGSEIIE